MSKLKYLFIAEFKDGSLLAQTPEDKSTLDPEKRSQFYDVLESGKELKRFTLVEKKIIGKGNTITVDLENGIFYVNTLPVLLESEKLPGIPEKFELIFYRQHTHNMNVTFAENKKDILDMESKEHYCEYFIGWKCNIKGKSYQQKIGVS